MITVNIKKKDKKVDRIVINGHALYADYGKDIVCASVSSTVISSVNGILKLDSNYLKHNYCDDGLWIEICRHDYVIDTLIDNMIDCLATLATNYPKNIKIKEEE